MAIVSFHHRFIFVKTRKTAGTSLEVELSRLIEPAAIVTPVMPPEPDHMPRNYKRGLFRKAYYNHMTASEIRDFLGEEAYRDKYSFCFERDPIAKCLSYYNMQINSPFHRLPGDENMSWDEYCERGELPIDVEKYAVQNNNTWELIVDEVIPYEALQASLHDIGEKLGLGPIVLNSRAKGGYTSGPRIGREDVTPAQRTRILTAFEPSLRVAGLMDHYA